MKFSRALALVGLLFVFSGRGSSVSAKPAAPASAADPPEWSTPVKPFNIAGNIFYVGTQGLAAYLILSNQGAILLDGTLAKNAPLIERSIEQVGVPLHAVKRPISDHAHPDHVGALAQIKQDTGAQFWASPGDTWALEHGRVRGDTHYEPEPFAPIKVDRVIHDGEAMPLGDVTLIANLTPGHTPGCTSWSTGDLPQARDSKSRHRAAQSP